MNFSETPDYVSVSLQIDRSLLVDSLIKKDDSSLELVLMNSLLSKCYGSLVFNSNNPNSSDVSSSATARKRPSTEPICYSSKCNRVEDNHVTDESYTESPIPLHSDVLNQNTLPMLSDNINPTDGNHASQLTINMDEVQESSNADNGSIGKDTDYPENKFSDITVKKEIDDVISSLYGDEGNEILGIATIFSDHSSTTSSTQLPSFKDVPQSEASQSFIPAPPQTTENASYSAVENVPESSSDVQNATNLTFRPRTLNKWTREAALSLTSRVQRNEANGTLICPDCGKEFSTFSKASRHFLACHTNMRYLCRLCRAPSTTKDNLKIHIAKVHGMDDDLARQLSRNTDPVELHIPPS